MSIFLFLCVLVNGERQRKNQTDRRRDGYSQRTGLGGDEACRCIIWDCHACTPLTCVGSLIELNIDFIQLLMYPSADPVLIPCLHPAGQAVSVHKGI